MNFEIYSGKNNQERCVTPELEAVSDTVVRLTRGLPRNNNHIIYFDNFYTNLLLMSYFAKEKYFVLVLFNIIG